MSEFSVQQQKAINEYRSKNNLGYVISDAEVASIMQKEMKKTGKIYPGFESLATGKSGSTDNKSNVFGTGFNSADDMGVSVEKSCPEVPHPRISPTPAQQFTIDFLKNITGDAKDIVDQREKEAGVLSSVVNTWKEIFDKELAKSTITKEIKTAQDDIMLLEAAANGRSVNKNYFTGETNSTSFEEMFKKRRGVDFNEEAIADCDEKSNTFARVKTASEMINTIKSELAEATKGDVTSQMNPEKSSAAIVKAFNLSGLTKAKDMNAVLKQIEEKYKDNPDIKKFGGNLRLEKNSQGQPIVMRTTSQGKDVPATNEELQIIAKETCMRLDMAYADALGVEIPQNATSKELTQLTQDIYNKHQKEYEDSFSKAFGKKDLKILSEKYVQAQQQGVANIEAGLNIASMALMVIPGAAVTTSGWLLKGSVALKNTSTGAKIVKSLNLVDKTKKLSKAATALDETLQGESAIAKTLSKGKLGISRQAVLSAGITGNITLQPAELLEKISSENGMSAEDWENWGKGVLQNSIYMTLGAGSSKIAEQGAAMYKTKALVNTLKNTKVNGKLLTTDEIASMVKANPVKFPKDIVQSFNKVVNRAKLLQVSTEVSLDISSTYMANKGLGNGDLTNQDWIMSVGFALSGGVLQKQFASLNTETKIKYLQDAFKDLGISKEEASNILKTMDDISSGKIRVKKEKNTQITKPDTPAGSTDAENAALRRAREESPASAAETKIREQWQQSDIDTPAVDSRVDLHNLDLNAGLKDTPHDVHNEVTSLIFKGQLGEKLTRKYQEAGKVFEEIAQKRSADIQALADKYPSDNQKFAEGVVKILSDELGMKGLEPTVKLSDTKDADGYLNWPDGQIEVNTSLKDKKAITELISHEFTHLLQFRDVLAQFGEEGLAELIAKDKNIPAKDKPALIKKVVNNSYNQKLLQNLKDQKATDGSVNDYLRRIYKDEFTNTADVHDSAYTAQLTEREAYNLGSERLGKNVNVINPQAELKPLSEAEITKLKEQNADNLYETSEGTLFSINGDGSITKIGKRIPAGLNTLSEAEFYSQAQSLCRNTDGTMNSIAKEFMDNIQSSKGYENYWNPYGGKLEEFKSMTDNCKVDGVYDNELLGYAKELFAAGMKKEDRDLRHCTYLPVSYIMSYMKDADTNNRAEMFNAAKELMEIDVVRNDIVDDIIKSCTETDANRKNSFNKKAFESVKDLFLNRNSHPYEQDYAYSLRVAEIAKSSTRWTKDNNGNWSSKFDDIYFEAAKIYDRSGDYVHVDLQYAVDKKTNEIDISQFDEYTRKYFTNKLPQEIEKGFYSYQQHYKNETLEALKVNGEYNAQNCFAAYYMINNLNIKGYDVSKLLQTLKNDKGVVDMSMLRVIKEEYDPVSVSRILDLGTSLYNDKGQVSPEAVDVLRNSMAKDFIKCNTRSDKYDITDKILTDGHLDIEKLKQTDADLRSISEKLKNTGVKTDNNNQIIYDIFKTGENNSENLDKIFTLLNKLPNDYYSASSKTIREYLLRYNLAGENGINIDKLKYYSDFKPEMVKALVEVHDIDLYLQGKDVDFYADGTLYIRNNVSEQSKAVLKENGIDIDFLIETSKNKNNKSLPLSPEQQSNFETVFDNADDVLSKADMSDGINLNYSRTQFESDVTNLLRDLSSREQTELLRFYGLKMQDGKLEGVPCKPSGAASNELQGKADILRQHIDKYLNNSVKCDNPQLKQVYEALTKDFPEFSMLAGKTGSDGQRVDVKTLAQLKSLVSNSSYQGLSPSDKKLAKLSILFNSFEEINSDPKVITKNFVVDNDGLHFNITKSIIKSSEFTNEIIARFNLDDREKYRLINIVDNIGWSEKYKDKTLSADNVAVNTRYGDLNLSKAVEDIINPGNNIDLTAIKQSLAKVHQNTQIINSATMKELAPYFKQSKINGIDCEILDLRETKLPENTYFMGHFTERSLTGLYDLLGNKSDKVFLSNSLISAESARSFAGRSYGIISEFDNVNVAEASSSNIDSGFGKNYAQFTSNMSGNGEKQIASTVMKNLGLTKNEYGMLMEQIADKNSFNDISDCYVNGKFISKDDIISAHNTAYAEMQKFSGEQNEITIMNQKPIAFVYKANSSTTWYAESEIYDAIKSTGLKKVIILP